MPTSYQFQEVRPFGTTRVHPAGAVLGVAVAAGKAQEEWRQLSKDDRLPKEGALPIFTVSPEIFRKRTSGEMGELRHAQERERAERYRGVYTNLDLRVVAHKDGTLELTWRAGKGVSEACASPKCTASETTLLS
jgi:hypothetical protein